MNVYIFRHGRADFGKKAGSDDPPLNSEGVADVTDVVSLCSSKFGLKPTAIASSPLARAQQTADLAKKALGFGREVLTQECLFGDRKPEEVYAFLSEFGKSDRIVLVSHMPLISELLLDLTGGHSEIELLNGSIANIAVEGKPGKGRGKLIWLIPPPARHR
jgi:phosphohistidine phosphatase